MRVRGAGSTLIELLVVVAIIALLLVILLPVLGRGRERAGVAQCLSGLRQVGVGVHGYAADHRGVPPTGPAANLPAPYDTTVRADLVAFNVIWLHPRGAASDYPNGAYLGHGVLLNGYVTNWRAMVCEASNQPGLIAANFENTGSATADGLVNLMYRSFDHATGRRLDDLGHSDPGVRATVLAWDLSQRMPAGFVGPGEFHALNHDARVVNALYVDGHATTHRNDDDRFTLRQADYAGFPGMGVLGPRIDA